MSRALFISGLSALALLACGRVARDPAGPAASEYAAAELVFAPAAGAQKAEPEGAELPMRPPAPWDRLLGASEQALVRLEVGGERRWAQLAGVGHPLEARVRVPGGAVGPACGARIVLDLLVARRMPGPPVNPRVALSVWRGSALLAEIETPLAAPETWWTAALPFELPADWTGELVRVRIEPRVDAGPGPASFYLAVAGAVIERPVEGRVPTVVLVTSDTHRGDHLGAAQAGVPVRTPALDALAARGVLFEDCFAPSHVTLPSHAALFTGSSPRDTGVLDNNTALSAEAPTLAEAFQEAGWLTAAAVSLDILGDTHSGFGQGFERLSAPEGTRGSRETVDAALRWLDAPHGRPLFLWVHVADAHAPYEPAGGALDYPADADAFDPARPVEGEPPSWLPGVRDMEYVRALYRGEVVALDRELGRLFEHPRVRDGVLALTADHGEVLGRHGIWWRHKDLYPDTLHVPLIMAWPGGPAGVRVREPVELLDLGRTLLERAGLKATEFPGRDLAEAPSGPRFSLATGARSAALQSGDWHLILDLADTHRVELYERARDPYCERDRVDDEPARAAELRAELVAWLQAAGPRWTGARGRDPAMLRRLGELGYGDTSGGSGETTRAPPPDCPCAWCARWR